MKNHTPGRILHPSPFTLHRLLFTISFCHLITVCRFVYQPSQQFLDAVAQLAYCYVGELPVKQIHLISCNAACMPETRIVWYMYNLQLRRNA